MKFLASIVATILISLIFSLTFTYVVRSVVNATYLKQLAKETRLYDSVADILPDQLASTERDASRETRQINQIISSIVTPGYVEGKLAPFLDGLDARYFANGAAPTLDLTDFRTQLLAAGLDVPQDAIPSTVTIPAEADASIKEAVTKTQNGQQLALISTLVLLLILILMSVKMHAYGSLIYVFVMSAILQVGLYFVLLKGVPKLIVSLPFDAQFASIKPVIERVMGQLSHDLAAKALVAAAFFAGIGCITLGVSLVSRARHKGEPVKSANTLKTT